jgi:hypothetical protein
MHFIFVSFCNNSNSVRCTGYRPSYNEHGVVSLVSVKERLDPVSYADSSGWTVGTARSVGHDLWP